MQSMGVYEAARTLDLKIPEQLSVIGFDDVQTAAYMGPALTTVRQPLQDMAAAAVRMIIDKSHGRPIQNRSIYPTTLIVRGQHAPTGDQRTATDAAGYRTRRIERNNAAATSTTTASPTNTPPYPTVLMTIAAANDPPTPPNVFARLRKPQILGRPRSGSAAPRR